MIRILPVILVLILSSAALAQDGKVVQLVRVIDGDTIVVNIDGWPDIIGREIGVRLGGCDTPELRDKRPQVRSLAILAKEYVTVRLQDAGVIELRNITRGKYFRLVADIYADGVSLTDMLIDAGLAQPYDGGTKPVW